MSKPADVVYNPTNPIEYQISKTTGILGEDELTVDNFVDNPVAIRLLIREQMQMLVELQGQKDELASLREEIKQFANEKQLLLVEATKLKERGKERENVSLLEIPLGFLGGFAINILTADIRSHLGWFLIVISLVCILLLRGKQILQTIQRVTGRGEEYEKINSGSDYTYSR